MSFRIGKHKALLASGFRQALAGQTKRAIRKLDFSAKNPPPAGIHSARKRMKKVRTLLCLLESTGFSRIVETDYSLLRDASREVAPARNTDANIEALKTLCKHLGADRLRFSKAFGALEAQRNEALRTAAASMHKAAMLLKALHSRIDAWEEPSVAWKDVRRALKRIYKRGRDAFRKASREPDTENLHRWRKRAKELHHILRLIVAIHPGTIHPLSRNLRKLCALLGGERDLAFVQMTLDQESIGKEKSVLNKLIAKRRRELQRKIVKLGGKCFAVEPKAFIGKLDC